MEVFFFPPNTRTCSVATPRATSTLTDMCVRQDCQFKNLFAVLVLAAAVAHIHGQGKNLGFMRTFKALFRVLSSVQTIRGEGRARDTRITTVRSTSVYGEGVLPELFI